MSNPLHARHYADQAVVRCGAEIVENVEIGLARRKTMLHAVVVRGLPQLQFLFTLKIIIFTNPFRFAFYRHVQNVLPEEF